MQPRKKAFQRRNNYGCDPSSALESELYRKYIRHPNRELNKKNAGLFRRRFLMPYDTFKDLVMKQGKTTGFQLMRSAML